MPKQFSTYKDFRDIIQTGDLYFVTTDGIVSGAIRLFTGSIISHVGMFVRLGSRVFTVECLFGSRCRMMYASERLKGQSAIFLGGFEKKLTSEQILDSVLPDISKLGYNIVGAVLGLFVKITPRGSRFCSEWVAEKLKISIPGLRAGITPQLLLTYLSK